MEIFINKWNFSFVLKTEKIMTAARCNEKRFIFINMKNTLSNELKVLFSCFLDDQAYLIAIAYFSIFLFKFLDSD